MVDREEVQTILEGILGSDFVYFQPPMSIKISYPCIVYNLDDLKTKHANDLPYAIDIAYKVTLISKDPDIYPILINLALLPKSSFDRFYLFDNLNHYVFTIYF